jgi:hypothetical protein
LKQKRAHNHYNTWQPVSLYDSEDYFRGPAIFETEKEAKSYMKKYNDRLTNSNRNNLNRSYNQENNKIKIQLKIFKENEKLQIN